MDGMYSHISQLGEKFYQGMREYFTNSTYSVSIDTLHIIIFLTQLIFKSKSLFQDYHGFRRIYQKGRRLIFLQLIFLLEKQGGSWHWTVIFTSIHGLITRSLIWWLKNFGDLFIFLLTLSTLFRQFKSTDRIILFIMISINLSFNIS